MRPYLYTVVEEAVLDDMLGSLQACIDIPLQVTDEFGNTLIDKGSQARYCQRLSPFFSAGDSCARLHMDAARRAVDLGEPYIFACHANLNHMVYPLMSGGALLSGAVLAGPFLLDAPDSTIIAEVAQRYTLSAGVLLELYDDLAEIRVLDPASATKISKLLYYLFSNLISSSRQQLILNRSKQLQQARINESIQMYKSFGEAASHYPYEKEKLLIAKVKAGDAQEAKGILNELLGYVLFSEGNKLSGIKTRALELASLLSRAAIEGGAAANFILSMNNNFLLSLNQAEDFDVLCLRLQEIVEAFTDTVFNTDKNVNSIKRAMAYIARQYHAKLTLEDAAAHVHLTPAYFSTLFRRSSGIAFKEYLNMVRVEEAKRLLANTDYAVIDIAVAVGFDDQGYFSKVFKKFTGMTPRQYR